MSCKKAWEVLTNNEFQVAEEVNANKNPVNGDGILDVVKDAREVIVASGKKTLVFDPVKDQEAMLAKIQGRTGNLRAPSLRIQGRMYIGYNEDIYGKLATL